MKLLLLAALVAAASAQMPPTPDPAFNKCHCSLGVHTLHEDTALFDFRPLFENECDHDADRVCREECTEHRDVLEAAGSWSVFVPERNSTVGDEACANLGRDETLGLHCQLYHSVCDQPSQRTSHGLHEPLCCTDGRYVQC